jgi:hypothetical protein
MVLCEVLLRIAGSRLEMLLLNRGRCNMTLRAELPLLR